MENLDSIVAEARSAFASVTQLADLEQVKAR